MDLLERKIGLYFSYNPKILDLEDNFVWQQGEYALEDILQVITERQDVNYTIIGNQLVFYLPGEEPGLARPFEEALTLIVAVFLLTENALR